MKKVVDVRGLDCPQPVIEIKKALEQKDYEVLEIITDSSTTKENISSLLKKMNYQILSVSEKEDDFHFLVAGNENQIHKSVEVEAVKESNRKTLLITSDKIGEGEEELGKMLMKAFTFSLTEMKNKPAAIIFMNHGVKLCVEDAETLSNLTKLSKSKVKMLVCGTCLNYYHLQEKLKVGTVSNMYEIAEQILSKQEVITL